MVSVDCFRQELLAQMSRATTQGRIDILVNSGELVTFECRLAAMLCRRKLRLAMFFLSNAPTARG